MDQGDVHQGGVPEGCLQGADLLEHLLGRPPLLPQRRRVIVLGQPETVLPERLLEEQDLQGTLVDLRLGGRRLQHKTFGAAVGFRRAGPGRLQRRLRGLPLLDGGGKEFLELLPPGIDVRQHALQVRPGQGGCDLGGMVHPLEGLELLSLRLDLLRRQDPGNLIGEGALAVDLVAQVRQVPAGPEIRRVLFPGGAGKELLRLTELLLRGFPGFQERGEAGLLDRAADRERFDLPAHGVDVGVQVDDGVDGIRRVARKAFPRGVVRFGRGFVPQHPQVLQGLLARLEDERQPQVQAAPFGGVARGHAGDRGAFLLRRLAAAELIQLRPDLLELPVEFLLGGGKRLSPCRGMPARRRSIPTAAGGAWRGSGGRGEAGPRPATPG